METKLRAIIVDDEQSARDVLSNLLARHCPEIEIIDKCTDITEGVQSIKTHQPDVVFLDIEMPNYAGYEIVSFFDKIDFEIIFVTAYNHYAIKAFEVSALDYLLKPIDVDRLKSAVDKSKDKKQVHLNSDQFKVLSENLKSNEVKNIFVPFQGNQEIVAVQDILALEANESYTRIHTNVTSELVVSKNLKHFERVLSDHNIFFRTHKSWIINLNQIQNYSSSKLEVLLNNGLKTKLSKYKKTEFEEAITRI